MDVSGLLKEYADQNTTNTLPRSTPVVTDPALFAAFDNTPVDAEEYKNLEPHLISLALTSTQALVSALYTLPTKTSALGPITILPTPTTLLPREKPLPKPKPLTKWERFAKEKGISHKKREKEVWDEEKQEWVARWGFKGKNREAEDQWLHEVKGGDNADHDPAKTSRDERKARTTKNIKQQAANIAAANKRAAPPVVSLAAPGKLPDTQEGKKKARTVRKEELNRSMLISKTSTASLGKFDEKITGEPKARGMKRKFESNVGPNFADEKEKALGMLKRVERGESKKFRKGGEGVEGGVNARKALRFTGGADRQKVKTTGKKGKRK